MNKGKRTLEVYNIYTITIKITLKSKNQTNVEYKSRKPIPTQTVPIYRTQVPVNIYICKTFFYLFCIPKTTETIIASINGHVNHLLLS